MTHLDVSNSSTDSSSGSTSDSSSSESSSSSSGSASSSSDSESSNSDTPATTSAPPPKSPAKTEELKKKEETKQRRSSKVKISSSSEDDTPKVPSPLPPRRRASAKPKAAAVLSKGKSGSRLPSGAKTPKPIPKTIPKSNKSDSGSLKKKSIFSPDNSSESDSESKSSKSTKDSPKSKRSSRKSSEEKDASTPIQIDNDDSNSKDSSSKDSKDSKVSKDSKDSKVSKDSKESTQSNRSKDSKYSKDSTTISKTSTTHSKASTVHSKSSVNSKSSVVSKASSIQSKASSSKSQPSTSNSKSSNSKDSAKRKNGHRPNGPPPKRPIEDKSASSCTSSQSSIESVSDTDSDSEPTPKKEPVKTGKTKPPSNSSKETTGKSGDSGDSLGTVTRKLTRSLSARVSRMATAARPTHTDTDSEVDEKPNTNHIDNNKSKDNKKNIFKGRGGIGRSPIKPPSSPPDIKPPGERVCPVRGCDSSGHLGGKSERHFTFDACPVYHNVTSLSCVAAGEERAAAGQARRRALLQLQQRSRPVPSIDQRAYQLKVKDMRSKWKGSQELKEKLATIGNDDMNPEREPILDGFAPDYDLKLFREAQALAAINIEEELGDLPSDRGTRYVVMGKYMMEVWYQSPYPGAAARVPRLFVCEFCLNHHKSALGANRHKQKCVWRHPPGDEVYRKDSLSVWQVDGRKHKQYCQQLCLLAKFFLDHKTLYYDVEPFLFYVMTCSDDEGCHVVGYFSKEKNSFQNYNVSCILTLPPYQRQGYGRLLIDFSYLLTKVEGKVGSPETPLSDLGLISYRSYWKEALLKRLCSAPGSTLCIRDLSKDLAIASSDIVSTLQERGLMKYWKGKHIVLKKQEVLEEVSRRAARARCVDPSCLRWWGGAPPPR